MNPFQPPILFVLISLTSMFFGVWFSVISVATLDRRWERITYMIFVPIALCFMALAYLLYPAEMQQFNLSLRPL